jgi:hypothetical protein
MRGTSRSDTLLATTLPVDLAVAFSTRAHWLMKHNSATVATERPTATLDSQVSNKQSLGMS